MKTLSQILVVLLIILVGTSVLAPINTAVTAVTTPTYSASVVSIAGLITLFFVIMLLYAILKAMDLGIA